MHGTEIFPVAVFFACIYNRYDRYGNGGVVLCEIGLLFPKHLRNRLPSGETAEGLEEIRVRAGQPIEFIYGGKIQYLSDINQGKAEPLKEGQPGMKYRATGEDIAEMMNYISNYSLYAYRNELKQGYITVEGGHRIGVAGQAAVSDGKITGISRAAFLNIRVAHERIGCAKSLLPLLYHGTCIYNTLILSPPGAGKTTLLRDSIRSISAGEERAAGLKVSVVDERSEIAACYHGVPQNDVGPRTDVLDGCSKAEGILLLLRAMSPEVIAVDELGTERDFLAVEQAVHSGSGVLGTIHAGSIGELKRRPFVKKWMKNGVFERFIVIEREQSGRRNFLVYDKRMEQIC